MDKFIKETSQSNLSENQQLAVDYIRNNKIDTLFTEMLNNVVQSKSNEPVVHMIRYLSTLVNESDLEKENIKIEPKEKIELTPLIKEFYMPEETTIFLKNFIDPKIFEKLKNIKTKLGGHISHIINTGLKVDNKETVGIYATDGDAYTQLNILFRPAITMLHDYDKKYALFELPEHIEIFTQIESKLIREKLLSIRFKYARNLKNYPYIPYAKSHTRKEIKEKLLSVLRKHSENENGKFYENFPNKIEDSEKLENLENEFFDKEENFFNSLNMSREHTGILLSQDEKVAYLINYNDHLLIVILDETCNFSKTYDRLKKIHQNLNDELEFDFHSEFGYLNSCPSNVGQGLKISAWLNIPNVVNQGNFLVCCKRWSLRFKRNILLKGNYEIASKHKIGVNESSFVNAFIVKVCSLINFENNLLENPNFVEKPLDTSKIKSSLNSIYLNFFDKYKYVCTPNLQNFNSIFNLNQNNKINIQFKDKESLFVYRDFIFDYVAGFTNVNLNELSHKNLNVIYNEQISEEDLKIFDKKSEDAKANGLIGKQLKNINLILCRNLKFNNFNEILIEEKLLENYEKFLIILKEVVNKFDGTIYEENEIVKLYHSEFKFVYEEISQLKICAYVSKDDKILILFNGINHIKFCSISNDAKISQIYQDLMKFYDFINSKLEFDFDKIYGYLTTHPLNCGSSFEIRLEYDNVNYEEIQKISEKYDLDCNKILSSDVEVYNMNKINLSHTEILKKIIAFIDSI